MYVITNKVKNTSLDDQSRDILAAKTASNFSWPYSRIRPAKLTNHSTRTNCEI